MLKSIVRKFGQTDDSGLRFGASFLIAALAGLLFAHEFIEYKGLARDTRVELTMLTIFGCGVLPALLAGLVALMDFGIQYVARFVTRGEHSPEAWLVRTFMLHEEEHDRYLEWRFVGYRSTLGPLGALAVLVSTVLLVVAWTVTYPIFTLTILSVVGLIAALLYLARFVYTLSTKLTGHMNDPDAHQKS